MTAQSPSYTLCPPTRPQFSQSGAPSSVSSPRQAQAFPLGWLQGSDRSQRSCYLCPKWRPPSTGLWQDAGARCWGRNRPPLAWRYTVRHRAPSRIPASLLPQLYPQRLGLLQSGLTSLQGWCRGSRRLGA